jgi:hypothetical protein
MGFFLMGFFLELLPDELITIRPLIDSYYRAIGVEEPPARMDNYFQYSKGSMVTNPQLGYVGKIFAAYKEEPEYPLEFIGEAAGYIWFYMTRNIHNEPFLFVEHIYTKDNNPQIMHELLKIAVHYMKRLRLNKVKIDTATEKLYQHWTKLFGFKESTRRLEWEGNIEDLEQRLDRLGRYVDKTNIFRKVENGFKTKTGEFSEAHY